MITQDNKVQWLVSDELKQDQFKFIYDTSKIIYDSAVRDKMLANEVLVLDSVLPKLIAYRSIMVIRGIQMKQAAEKKKLKEKMEREGKGFTLEGNTNPRYMTEFEQICVKMDEHNNDEKNAASSLSEEQL